MKFVVIFPLLVLAAGQTPKAEAQSPGTFTATRNLTTARAGHTVTVLPNGKVLVAGGYSGEGLISAELYDPSTGVYTPTGNMITARSGHSATLLPNGKVLITQGTYGPSSYAELYDPATGTFTVAGGTTRVSGIATLLKDGKVLITGNTAQLYDPITNNFAPTGSYVGPFYLGPFFWPDTATLLQDGRVLIVGNAAGDGYIEHEELYDPVTGTFRVTGKPHTFGFGSDIWSAHTATLLRNGKVLLAGGASEDFGYFSIAQLYDPSTDTFAATANMAIARAGHTVTLLPDGTVLVAGGQLGSSPLISAELYDPATGTFSSTGNMAVARAYHLATRLFDGRVLISGGWRGDGVALPGAEIYTPAVLALAPVLFSLSGDGRGQGAIWHSATGQIASSANPATAGDVLSMYTTPLFQGGAIPPQAAVGGQRAEILYFSDAPGYAGYDQVNFRVPSSVAPGPAVPVWVNYLGRRSNEVTIGVY